MRQRGEVQRGWSREVRQKSKGRGLALKSPREQSNVGELRMLRVPHMGQQETKGCQ